MTWIRGHWRTIWIVVFTAAVAAALFDAGWNRQRITRNQQRILEQQAQLEAQQSAIEMETADRIQSVCRTALDTRDIIEEVVEAIEAASGDDSALRKPAVRRRISDIVESRPVQCDRVVSELSGADP